MESEIKGLHVNINPEDSLYGGHERNQSLQNWIYLLMVSKNKQFNYLSKLTTSDG